MSRAIFKINPGEDVMMIGSEKGRYYSFLEFFYEGEDKITQLLSISTLREDPKSFRQFRKQYLHKQTLECLLPPETIEESEYYRILIGYPPKRVFTEVAYREFRPEANYTLAVNQENGVGFFEIHTFGEEGDKMLDDIIVPKRFRRFCNKENLLPLDSLGAAFYNASI